MHGNAAAEPGHAARRAGRRSGARPRLRKPRLPPRRRGPHPPPYNGKRWIACRLQFRGWQRRRCCNRAASPSCSSSTRRPHSLQGTAVRLCRHEDYAAFVEIWRAPPAGRRRRDRRAAARRARRSRHARAAPPRAPLDELPDGAFVLEEASRGWCRGSCWVGRPPATSRGDRGMGGRRDGDHAAVAGRVLRAGWQPVCTVPAPVGARAMGGTHQNSSPAPRHPATSTRRSRSGDPAGMNRAQERTRSETTRPFPLLRFGVVSGPPASLVRLRAPRRAGSSQRNSASNNHDAVRIEPGTHITPAAICWSPSADSPPGRCGERRVGVIERARREREHDREHPADEHARGHVHEPLQPVEAARHGRSNRTSAPRTGAPVKKKSACSRSCDRVLRSVASYSPGTCQRRASVEQHRARAAARASARPLERTGASAGPCQHAARERPAKPSGSGSPQAQPGPAEQRAAAARRHQQDVLDHVGPEELSR